MKSRFTDEHLSWRKLCRAAALEQNPDRLSQTVSRINSILESRRRTLRRFADSGRNTFSNASSRLDRVA